MARQRWSRTGPLYSPPLVWLWTGSASPWEPLNTSRGRLQKERQGKEKKGKKHSWPNVFFWDETQNTRQPRQEGKGEHTRTIRVEERKDAQRKTSNSVCLLSLSLFHLSRLGPIKQSHKEKVQTRQCLRWLPAHVSSAQLIRHSLKSLSKHRQFVRVCVSVCGADQEVTWVRPIRPIRVFPAVSTVKKENKNEKKTR